MNPRIFGAMIMGGQGYRRDKPWQLFLARGTFQQPGFFEMARSGEAVYGFGDMQWYYSKNGTQLGPVEEADLRSKLASGEVTTTDLIWREGMADWQPAARVPEMAVAIRPQTNLGMPVGGPATQSPYVPPTMQSYAPQPVTPGAGKATTSMVLGIVGLVFSICGCYTILLVLPCGIMAIVFGNQVKALVAANQAPMEELGKAKAGVIMGWIAIGICVLFTALIPILGLAGGIMNEASHR